VVTIFMRLGSRLRGPEGTQVGAIRRINISNIVCWNAAGRVSSIISGIPGHDIEDVHLSNIRIYSAGGGTPEVAATQPAEKENAYPEPTMFGPMPAYGFYMRHVKGLQISDVNLTYLSESEARPPFVMEDVKGLDVRHVRARHDNGVPVFRLNDVSNVDIKDCQDVPDTKKDRADRDQL
jgi:hypothetical protein